MPVTGILLKPVQYGGEELTEWACCRYAHIRYFIKCNETKREQSFS
jgi:hypothetical protein